MKKILILLSIFCQYCFAQQYDVALIPDSLKKNANAVKRMEELRVIIKSPSKATIKHKYAITILNEAGADWAAYQMDYDKAYLPDHISGNLYDATGKELKSVKKKDIGDYSSNDESSLMTDNRIKRHNFYHTQYPYTIAYDDEQDMDGIFFLPSWHPIESTKLSVVQSNFIVEMPSDFTIRYKQFSLLAAPVQENINGKKIYSWSAKNYAAILKEPYQPEWNSIAPAVYIAPNQFEIYNYKGDMSNWLGLGLFIKDLNQNKQILPENIKQEVHRLTDGIKSQQEKIFTLYKYLQNNTRYISVQMGIGGWQPFDANYVATKKYGDCKALSNYMVSLLKEAAIPAKYVLVTAGDNKKGLWDDFPSPYFNHAIVCVPQAKDSIWLECTSQINSPGFMGSFTGNRKVLLIDDDGGHVVTTPHYKAADNLQLRKIDADISNNGTLSAKVLTHFTGIQLENVQSLMHRATEKQKRDYLNNALSLPTYTVEKYEYTETKNYLPAIDEYLVINAPNYATITGKRLFITPNFFNRSTSKLSLEEPRKNNIELSNAYVDADTISIHIPADYEVESMPATVSLKTNYGNYSINFSLKESVITVLRINERKEGNYPKQEYEAIANFFNAIYKADRSRIVLTKKST